jgi:hypothetical protein
MSDYSLAKSDAKHIRDAWIWAAVIVTVAVLITLSGLYAQFANQSPWDADSGANREPVVAHSTR